jgi:serine/threonine-protein kinase
MATVYLAEDLKHDRRVALKLLKPELAAVLGAERFVQEIKTTAALQHPHILPLFDSGAADGFLFYVMPFIDGETLRAKLDRETQLGVDESVRIAREVADALHYAHERGIVHRDVKPENILLHGGHAMVADFGIALAVSAAAGGRMTETGLSLGTPHYMSPEQATAEKDISARSDVYSLGSVLYEMLTGNPPHVGASAQQIIMKIITTPADLVTVHRKSVPPNVAAAVAKSLEKLPADRFESAKAFADALGSSTYTNAAFSGTASGYATTSRRGVSMRAFTAMCALTTVLLGVMTWAALKPAPHAVVTRERTVLWDTPQIPNSGVRGGLAFSPDGGAMVFVDSTAAGKSLFIKEHDRLESTALAGTTDVANAPAFSPDGAWIAFISRDGKVKKVPRLGGSAITIADSARSDLFTRALAWLDDGTILYVHNDFQLRGVGAEGGAVRRVTRFARDSTGRGIVAVNGLPGGHAALLTTCTNSCVFSELRVLDLRSLKVTMLQDQALLGWALPGGAVAFVRRDGGVMAAPFDFRTLTFTRAPTPVLEGVRTAPGGGEMVVSPTGTLIYVVGAAGGTERYQPVWVTRAGVATPIDPAWTLSVNAVSCTCNGGLALSPDGRQLALNVYRNGLASDIDIKQLDAPPFALTPLTFKGENANAAWTVDGRSIMYFSLHGGITSLVQRRADGTGAVDTLAHSVGGRNLIEGVPTRDTNLFILRLGQKSRRDLVLRRRGDTADMALVADSTFGEVYPALSPDGKWLAYSSDESGHFEVYVRPFPDVNARRVQVSQAGGAEPRWSRSGRELFFRNRAGALVAATVVPAASFTLGPQTVLFDARQYLVVGAQSARSYDVAPGDQRFVFLRKVQTAGAAADVPMDKLVQVTNWAAEVQAKLKGKSP